MSFITEYSEEDYWFSLLSELGSTSSSIQQASQIHQNQSFSEVNENDLVNPKQSIVNLSNCYQNQKDYSISINNPHHMNIKWDNAYIFDQKDHMKLFPTNNLDISSNSDQQTLLKSSSVRNKDKDCKEKSDIIETKDKDIQVLDLWGESDDMISDRIEFIFCNTNDLEMTSDYYYFDESESNFENRFLLSLPLNIQPTIQKAFYYTKLTLQLARNALHNSKIYDASNKIIEDSQDGSSTISNIGEFEQKNWTYYTSKNIHQSMLYLAQHINSPYLRRSVTAASGIVIQLKDLAVIKLAQYIRSNIYLSSFIGCIHESTLFMIDRIQAGVELYIHILQGDDPENIHLNHLKDSPNWKHLLLRCSMASLTWKQRQLLEETRDGGILSDIDYKQLMKAQITEYDKLRVVKVASEFFYVSEENEKISEVSSVIDTQLLLEKKKLSIKNNINNNSHIHHKLTSKVNDNIKVTNSNNRNDLIAENIELLPSTNKYICSNDIKIKNNDEINSIDTDINSPGLDDLKSNIHTWLVDEAINGDDDAQYALAKFFSPPSFEEKTTCAICNKLFNLMLFRHHCRFCGRSICNDHSLNRRCIYRYGIIQPVRVCCKCVVCIDETTQMDNLIWKDLRISAYLKNKLIPYFHPMIDRGIDKVIRIADYSLKFTKNVLAFNFTTKMMLDTVDVLKRYGLTGFTGLLLRKDFMESIEMLRKISGMESIFTLSLHELTACVYYKLAIERGIRGCNPNAEAKAHQTKENNGANNSYNKNIQDYYCKDADDNDIEVAIKYAPLALNIVYEENPIDCQRLAKLQGWDMIFTNLETELEPEQPCYALFGTSKQRDPSMNNLTENQNNIEYQTSKFISNNNQNQNLEVVLVIRGTQTIQDVVTDIRAAPQVFPPPPEEVEAAIKGISINTLIENSQTVIECKDKKNHDITTTNTSADWDWLCVPLHQTYACGGMVKSAMYVLRELGPALRRLHSEGFRITIVGHSLGGAVACLLTTLLQYEIPTIHCISYGCPSCVDSITADAMQRNKRVISVVLHDDVICRITPQSIRLLLRELVVFREQMFQHLQHEWNDVLTRAASIWSPRHRNNYCNNNLHNDKIKYTIDLEKTKHSNIITNEKSAVIIDEELLTQLWIPGKIIHIYMNRGQWRASEVSRNFPDLRIILMQGNIFDDHRSENIFEALLEVRAVRKCSKSVPIWIPYNAFNITNGEGIQCSCCHNDFSWYSTFTGQAQEFRDKYNCRYCGHLVCGPCSTQRRAIPQLGFIFPKRICDQCVYKGDFAIV